MDRERLARALFVALPLHSDHGFADLSDGLDRVMIDGYFDLLKVADAILADIADQGFVIVPREPTAEMIDSFVARALCVSVHSEGGWSKYAVEQYKAMIAAGEARK